MLPTSQLRANMIVHARAALVYNLTYIHTPCLCLSASAINYRRYPPVQELPVQSAMLLPADGDSITADAYTTWGLDLKGYAWAGLRPICNLRLVFYLFFVAVERTGDAH